MTHALPYGEGMATSTASSAPVVGGRYMVSESALRAFPFGPVDGLDTRHGRAAQVRLVFVTDRWPEDALAEAVDRWRRLGCAEVCGMLDFGRYDDRGTWRCRPVLECPSSAGARPGSPDLRPGRG